ncbi:hypothetical protein PM082_008770 [Marasmius tenuissimus]|nr:hypothetical protein PM082_008770 [Marasmius tenuissimus]
MPDTSNALGSALSPFTSHATSISLYLHEKILVGTKRRQTRHGHHGMGISTLFFMHLSIKSGYRVNYTCSLQQEQPPSTVTHPQPFLPRRQTRPSSQYDQESKSGCVRCGDGSASMVRHPHRALPTRKPVLATRGEWGVGY